MGLLALIDVSHQSGFARSRLPTQPIHPRSIEEPLIEATPRPDWILGSWLLEDPFECLCIGFWYCFTASAHRLKSEAVQNVLINGRSNFQFFFPKLFLFANFVE
jgi:hypothetical protein